MIRLEMKNYNMVLIERQQKYQHYHQVKLLNINILQKNKYYLPIKAELQNYLSLVILFWEKLLNKLSQ